MIIKCTDCYEENDVRNDRCCRCGRLMDDARREQTRDHFEWQHHDAPNTIVRRDKLPDGTRKTVW
ncbi:hypothetical protein [Tumebacillus lipolyticus]|uniref:Uncharacterized protein n=1 Tax=Tumebacillus lipolyticus TaxID=1280370 RepID=A0ABW4ZTB6_9BACL